MGEALRVLYGPVAVMGEGAMRSVTDGVTGWYERWEGTPAAGSWVKVSAAAGLAMFDGNSSPEVLQRYLPASELPAAG